jgi:hypothetical protein
MNRGVDMPGQTIIQTALTGRVRKPTVLVVVQWLILSLGLLFGLIASLVVFELFSKSKPAMALYLGATLIVLLVAAWAIGGLALRTAINRRKSWALNVARLYMFLLSLFGLFGVLHGSGVYLVIFSVAAIVLLYMLFFDDSTVHYLKPQAKPASSAPAG